MIGTFGANLTNLKINLPLESTYKNNGRELDLLSLGRESTINWFGR